MYTEREVRVMHNEYFIDRMVTHDDLIIVNKGEVAQHHDQAAPHGRLFEILGERNGRRIVREISSNLVVVGGAITALENLTGATASWKPDTLNTIHSVSAVGVGTPKLALFGIGTGGSGLEFGSVIAPSIKQKDILSPIPIRYGKSVTGDDSTKYFMKKDNGSGGTYSWYLKEFTGTPTIKSCWKNAVSEDEDGTEILEDISTNPSEDGIETFTEIQIDMNTKDGREYFESTGAIATARFNTIGFYVGAKNAENSEYGDVRLYSVVTFNSRDLSLATSSSFLYRIYSLI